MDATVTVEVFEAQPNPLFGEAVREVVRFLRFSAAVACTECGRRSKHHWTMLVPFTAQVVPKNAVVLVSSGTPHPPGAPVCRAHPLAPAEQGTGNREIASRAEGSPSDPLSPTPSSLPPSPGEARDAP